MKSVEAGPWWNLPITTYTSAVLARAFLLVVRGDCPADEECQEEPLPEHGGGGRHRVDGLWWRTLKRRGEVERCVVGRVGVEVGWL